MGGGGEEGVKEAGDCAPEESSVWWEVLGAALMGLPVFGKKGGGGAYYYMWVQKHALLVCVCLCCVCM